MSKYCKGFVNKNFPIFYSEEELEQLEALNCIGNVLNGEIDIGKAVGKRMCKYGKFLD